MADLRDLGLSSYEDRAYRSLLGLGAVSAPELSEKSGVPEGRIYDVLESLETSGLVRAQTASRPKRYVAVEPEVAITRLVETRTRELEAEIERHEMVGSQLIETLPSARTVEDRFQTTAIGTEDAVELLFERLDAADERIAMVANAFTPEVDIDELGPDALDRLAAALERGVDVSILASRHLVETVPGELLDRLSREPFASGGFSARTTDELHGTFYLVDHVELCFEVVNPMTPDAVVGLVHLQDPTFALELEEQFVKHWETASPFDPA
ncbi:MAG: helix-turn-helix domain-containing protein [Haloferacaceae archaeon]